ncbi:MAG: Na+/H+ antiporter NhaC family protein [Candidatus Nanopelagicales bacterium]
MDEAEKSTRVPRAPRLYDALIPLLFLVINLVAAVALFGGDATAGPVQLAMFFAAAIAGLVGYKNGHSVSAMTKAAVDSVGSAMGAIYILFAVGALIGTWNMSGTIATMAEWGIKFLNPNFFYLTVAVVCALVALGIGSSWTVMGTLGVAFVAIAEAQGLSTALAAGAVISGAYFGDKMSPLSETTNLAPAVAGTDLYTHIRAMMATTIPSIIISLVIYLILGMDAKPVAPVPPAVAETAINYEFNTGILTMIPLVVVIGLAVRKVHPVLAVLAGAITAGLLAAVLQPQAVRHFVADDSGLATPWVMLKGIWSAMATGFTADTGVPRVDELLSGGGMEGMLNTVWLIVAALTFGGIMNYCGFLGRLIEPLRRRAKSPRAVMGATGATAIGVNVVAAEQYLAIVLTGNIYKQDFEQRGIAPQCLSRQIEDTATVTSVLVPWNSCGAYAAGVLNVATIAYLPFAFFNWINPLVSFFYDLMGWQIHRVPVQTEFPAPPTDVQFYGVDGHAAVEFPGDGGRTPS